MDIAVISDTHMPRGGRRLPQRCVELLHGSDLILHAGDLVQVSVLRELEAYGRCVAIHGNVDDVEVRALLPARTQVKVAGVALAMIHDAGPAPGRLERLRARFPGADAVIFGHSHLPLHERASDGFQIFNPGSPTERRRAPHRTMGLARVSGSRVSFELLEL
jgi:uncharacterized protein